MAAVAELSVKKIGTLVPTLVDDQGRPYCICGCGQVMTETAPGRFQCPDWVAIETAMRESLGQLIKAVSESLGQLTEAAFGNAPDPAGQRVLIDYAKARQPGPFTPLGALRMPRAEQLVDMPFGLEECSE